jgi:hypothetical protein
MQAARSTAFAMGLLPELDRHKWVVFQHVSEYDLDNETATP